MAYETDIADVELDGSITKIELMATDRRDLEPHEAGAELLCKHKAIESMRINDFAEIRDDHRPGQIQYVEFTPTSVHPSSHMEFSLGKALMRELLEYDIIVSALVLNRELGDHDHKIYFNEVSIGSDF